MKNRNLSHKDDWQTPPDFYRILDETYNFDFDPCPLLPNLNGLEIEWGERNFVNPPYSRPLKDMFVLKAIEQMHKGKLSVILLPVSTSTKLFHDFIYPNASRVLFVRKRLRFLFDGQDKGTGQHDSMVVVFSPNNKLGVCTMGVL